MEAGMSENFSFNFLPVCSYHVTYMFQSESTLYYVCLWTKWLCVRVSLQSFSFFTGK